MANPTEGLDRFLRTEGLKLLQGVPGVRILRREPGESQDQTDKTEEAPDCKTSDR